MMGEQPIRGGCDPLGQRHEPPDWRSWRALEVLKGNQKSHGGAHSACTLGCCGKIWRCGPPAVRISYIVVLQVEITELVGK